MSVWGECKWLGEAGWTEEVRRCGGGNIVLLQVSAERGGAQPGRVVLSRRRLSSQNDCRLLKGGARARGR